MNEVDKYIAEFDSEIQARLKILRKLFFEFNPHVEEKISYKIPAYKVGKHYLYFAGYKNHIGFYPVYGLDEIEDRLAQYWAKGTKASLHFKHNQALPLDLIRDIIRIKSKS